MAHKIRSTFDRFEIEDLAKELAQYIKKNAVELTDEEKAIKVELTKEEMAQLFTQAKLDGVKLLLQTIQRTSENPRLTLNDWRNQDKAKNPERHKWYDRVQKRYNNDI